MGFTVDRTSAFEYDVDEAICYLVNEVGSPRAANLLLDEIERTIGILEEAPYINGLSLRYGLGEAGMCEHLVRNYSIVYRVDGARVVLLRLLHQSQLADRLVIDWEN